MGFGLLVAACCLLAIALDQSAAQRLRGALRPAGPVSRVAPGHRLSGRRRREALSAVSASVPAALALELRSGRELGAALAAVAEEQPEVPGLGDRLRHAASVAGSGGDVAAALSGAGPAPDQVGLALAVTAACCGSAQSAGLPMADLLDAAAAAARSGISLEHLARAELAGARSTTLVLAVLPLVGIGLGQLVGAHPVQVLFGTGWGAGCLLAGLVFAALGWLWMRAITSGLRRSLP